MQARHPNSSAAEASTPAEQLLRPANGKARRYSVKRSELNLLGTRGNGTDCVCVVPLDDHDHLLKELFAEQRRYRALLATMRNEFQLLDNNGLDEAEHHCEWHIQQERKRLHTILADAKAPQEQGSAAFGPGKAVPLVPIGIMQIEEQMPDNFGECAAIWHCGGNYWTAAIYVWDATFNDSTTVAKWFHNHGAVEVFITHTLYDTNNGDRNGEVPEGGARQWLVEFSTKGVSHA